VTPVRFESEYGALWLELGTGLDQIERRTELIRRDMFEHVRTKCVVRYREVIRWVPHRADDERNIYVRIETIPRDIEAGHDEAQRLKLLRGSATTAPPID